MRRSFTYLLRFCSVLTLGDYQGEDPTSHEYARTLRRRHVVPDVGLGMDRLSRWNADRPDVDLSTRHARLDRQFNGRKESRSRYASADLLWTLH